MKRVVLAFVGTVAGLVILLGYKTAPAHHGSRPAALAPASPQPVPTHSSTPPTSAPHRSGAVPTRHRTPTTKAVTGAVVQTPYGPVQVRAVLTNGKLTAVTPLRLPNDNPHSQQISNYAAPQLRQEALKAGSARIDIVSGATYTSDGYAQSLQSALNG